MTILKRKPDSCSRARRSNEELNCLFTEMGQDWVNEQRNSVGGEINKLEKSYAKVWLYKQSRLEIAKDRKKEKLEERCWQLAFLIVGAVIALLSSNFVQKIETRKHEVGVISIVRADVQQHVNYLEMTAALFENIKEGKLPIKPEQKFRISLMSHSSLVVSALVGQLQFLPKDILPEVLEFYRLLDYCEKERLKIEASNPETKEENIELMDGYGFMMKNAAVKGRALLDRLKTKGTVGALSLPAVNEITELETK